MNEIVKVNTQIQRTGIGGVDALIDQFLIDSQVMENSKKRYKKSLGIYFRWIEANGFLLPEITLTELLKYKADLESKRLKNGSPLSNMTISAYMIAVKAFYNWAEGKRLVTQNPTRGLKSPKRENKFKREPLSEIQAIHLLEYFKKNCSLRDFTIINTLLYCGLRTIELVRLDIGDIVVKDGTRIINVQGKGKTEKDRWVILYDEAYLPIVEYLTTRKDLKSDSPIFCSEGFNNVGGRLIPGTISEIVKAGLRGIGLDNRKFTAHSLRHTAATMAMRMGATQKQVKEFLRHASENTTAGYVETLEEERRIKDSAEGMLRGAFKGNGGKK